MGDGVVVSARNITDRKQVEQEREHALAELQEAQQIALLGSWHWDPASGTRTWSAGMYAVYGRDPGGGPMGPEQTLTSVHADDLPRVQSAYANMLSGGQGFELDYRLLTGDRGTRTVHAIARPDPERPGSYRGTLQDVTERTRTEEELQLRSELLDLAHDAVIVRDPAESRVTLWNREAQAIYGYSRAEAVGQITHELLATVFPESRQAVDDALEREGQWVGELRHTCKDGTLIVVSSRQALQRDADGRPRAIIELNSDITKRKRAEEELAHIAALLKRTEEISKTGGWEYDLTTGELTWTDEVYRIYGVQRTSDPTEVTQAIAAYDPESAPIMDTAFKRLVAEGVPYDLELRLLRADGQRLWVRTIGRPVIDDGRIVRVGGNISDVTDRKRVEEALRASDQLFHSGFDDSPTGMALTALDGTLVEVNSAFALMLGFDHPAQLAGRDFARYTHPDDVAANREGIRMMVEDGKPYVAEKRYIRRNGTVVYALMGSTAVLDADSRPSMLFTQVQDITERKHAEAALRASEQRFRGGFENSPIGTALVGLDGSYVEVNATFARMLGFEDPAELAGHSFTDFIHPDEVAVAQAGPQRVIETGAERGERRYIRSDGAVVYTLYAGTLVRDADGQPLVIFGQVEDITERRRAEQEIRTLNGELEQRVAARTAELERANKELETFAYSVSHDLRAPLRALDGFSQALLEDYWEKLDEQGRHDLERVRAGAVRMGDLIDALLQLSRLSRWRLARVPVDISALAREVVAELEADQPDRRVEVEIQDGLLAEADLRLVRTVLQNLFANAYKFTCKAAQPRIRFGALVQDGVGVYFVADNGAGFEMARAERLFLPFHRLHRETEFPGDGIGLATVTRAVRKHGGTIWAQGAVNEGATFHFTLTPGAQPPPAAAIGMDVLPTWQPTHRE
ncbi:MAG: PAS domain S-box protein [Solirubrobacteraceae bacterium]